MGMKGIREQIQDDYDFKHGKHHKAGLTHNKALYAVVAVIGYLIVMAIV